MGKIWLLTKSNARSVKMQMFSFLIITIVSATILNIGIISLAQLDSSFYDKNESINGAHVATYMYDFDYNKKYKSFLESNPMVSQVETQDVLLCSGRFFYGNSNQIMYIIFNNMDAKHSISKYSYAEKSNKEYSNPIYLPYLFKTSGNYQVGDDFPVKIKNRAYNFTVAGFSEQVYYGSIYDSVVNFVIPDRTFRNIEKDLGPSVKGKALMARLNKTQALDMNENVALELLKMLENDNCLVGGYNLTNCYTWTISMNTTSASIIAFIILTFAILLSLIGVVVMSFRIVNNINNDMKNIGVLKAIGYNTRQIRGANILQYILCSGVGVIIGIVISYAILPYISELLSMQLGVVWTISFKPLYPFVTMLFLLIAVSTVVVLSTRRIRYLPPMTALRQGIANHSFKKNRVPLEKGRLPLWLALTMKSTAYHLRQNIMIFFIIVAVCFSCTAAVSLYYNTAINNTDFIKIIDDEEDISDIYISMTTPNPQLIEYASLYPDVEKVLTYSLNTLQIGTWQCSTTAVDDYSKVNVNQCYKGRYPHHDNEVAIAGLVALKNQKNIGDTINIGYHGKSSEYLITGLIQTPRNSGRAAALTSGGMTRIKPGHWQNLLLISFDVNRYSAVFMRGVEENFGDNVGIIKNMNVIVKEKMNSYTTLCTLISAIIMLSTALIVILLLYLVISTYILRQQRNFGIQKALGFTTVQLMIQVTLSFLPTIIAGCITGAIVSHIGRNPLTSLMFRNIGVMKVNMDINTSMLYGVYILIGLIAVALCIFASLRIRKISPYRLLQE